MPRISAQFTTWLGITNVPSGIAKIAYKECGNHLIVRCLPAGVAWVLTTCTTISSKVQRSYPTYAEWGKQIASVGERRDAPGGSPYAVWVNLN